jgi:3-deoxy-D-manno-octulosonic-acid transferase
MNWLYNNAVLPLLKGAFRLLSIFDPKVKRGFAGRTTLQSEIASHYTNIATDRKRIWIHVASFGELEQAKPVIEALRREQPTVHIHLTFFSPSGYDNAKGRYTTPDLITYSPFDDVKSIEAFVQTVKPDLALFAKYDVWPNAIAVLSSRSTPSILFSATLGEDSGRFFPVVRNFNKRVYSQLTKILVIRESDRQAFLRYGIEPSKIDIAGDTRFDQVLARQMRGRTFEMPQLLIERWKQESRQIVVVGSAWTEDIRILDASVTSNAATTAWVIVPHEPSEKHLTEMQVMVSGASRLSSLDMNANIVLVDSIGKLFDLYSIADLAYVGGGFGAGAHNTLEAAVFGRPVIVGPRHRKTKEVQELKDAGGAFEIGQAGEARSVIEHLLTDRMLQQQAGRAARRYVTANAGATERIMQQIRAAL